MAAVARDVENDGAAGGMRAALGGHENRHRGPLVERTANTAGAERTSLRGVLKRAPVRQVDPVPNAHAHPTFHEAANGSCAPDAEGGGVDDDDSLVSDIEEEDALGAALTHTHLAPTAAPAACCAQHEDAFRAREAELLGVIEEQRAAFRADIEDLEQQRTDDLAALWDEHWRRVNAVRDEYERGGAGGDSAPAPAPAPTVEPCDGRCQPRLTQELAEVLEELREKEDFIDELEEENKLLQDNLRSARKMARGRSGSGVGSNPNTPRHGPADTDQEELLTELDAKMEKIREMENTIARLNDAVERERQQAVSWEGQANSLQRRCDAATHDLEEKIEKVRGLEEANAALQECLEAKKAEEDIFHAAQSQLIQSKDAELREALRRAEDAEAQGDRVERELREKQKKQVHLLQLVDTQRDHIQRLQGGGGGGRTASSSVRSLSSASPDGGVCDRWERESRDTASVCSAGRGGMGGGGSLTTPTAVAGGKPPLRSGHSHDPDDSDRDAMPPPPAPVHHTHTRTRSNSGSLAGYDVAAADSDAPAGARHPAMRYRMPSADRSSTTAASATAPPHTDPYAAVYRHPPPARSSRTSVASDCASQCSATETRDPAAGMRTGRSADIERPGSAMSSRASDRSSSAVSVSSTSRTQRPALASLSERNTRLEQLRAQVEDARAERIRLQSKRQPADIAFGAAG